MSGNTDARKLLRFQVDGFLEFMNGFEAKYTAPVIIRGLPWRIMVMPKFYDGGKKYLGFFIQCNVHSMSSSWSCTANASLRLVARKWLRHNYEKQFDHQFNYKGKAWGFPQFMPFEQIILDDYCEDGNIILEALISADAVQDMLQTEVRFRFRIDGFSNFMNTPLETRLGPPVHMQRLQWKIKARSNTSENKKCLGFFLQCNAGSNASGWSCNAHARLRLIAQKDSCRNYERPISHLFTPNANDWGFTQFSFIDEIMSSRSGWYVHDSIILEVILKAEPLQGQGILMEGKSLSMGECVICLEHKLDCALVPCGHTCMCMACATRQKQDYNSCPMCRRQIDSVLKIYAP